MRKTFLICCVVMAVAAFLTLVFYENEFEMKAYVWGIDSDIEAYIQKMTETTPTSLGHISDDHALEMSVRMQEMRSVYPDYTAEVLYQVVYNEYYEYQDVLRAEPWYKERAILWKSPMYTGGIIVVVIVAISAIKYLRKRGRKERKNSYAGYLDRCGYAE